MNDLTESPQPESEAPDPGTVMLPVEFNGCLMGCTVDASGAPRMAYSLNKLAARERLRSTLTDEDARHRVWLMVIDITGKHGDRAPVFIDDAAFAEDKPKIWTPDRN